MLMYYMVSLFIVFGISTLSLVFLEDTMPGKYATVFSVIIFFGLVYVSILLAPHLEGVFNYICGWVTFHVANFFFNEHP